MNRLTIGALALLVIVLALVAVADAALIGQRRALLKGAATPSPPPVSGDHALGSSPSNCLGSSPGNCLGTRSVP